MLRDSTNGWGKRNLDGNTTIFLLFNHDWNVVLKKAKYKTFFYGFSTSLKSFYLQTIFLKITFRSQVSSSPKLKISNDEVIQNNSYTNVLLDFLNNLCCAKLCCANCAIDIFKTFPEAQWTNIIESVNWMLSHSSVWESLRKLIFF